MSPSRTWAGIGYLILSMICFAVLDAIIKHLVNLLPMVMVLWFRYVVQAVSTSLTLWPRQGRSLLRTQQPKLQLLRGFLLMMCSVLGFLSLQHMPLAEFAAIALLTPLAVTVLSRMLFKERISPLRWVLILGGFAGAMMIVRPGGHLAGAVAVLPLAMVLFYTAFQLLTSYMARTESPMTMHFYTGWVGTAAVSCLVYWHWTTDISPLNWALLVACGLLGSTAHYLFILAFARVTPVRLSPFLYLQVVFSTLAGWVAFSFVPAGWGLVGMVLIMVCGAGAGWLNAREKAPPEMGRL
ncbi:RhaT Permeases of the drug/metabolite transporter (DMT) superfamily [Burkholderiaceae bacterium]